METNYFTLFPNLLLIPNDKDIDGKILMDFKIC